MLMRPPANHSACGGCHFSTASHFLNQCSSSAMRAQKPSGSSLASWRKRSSSAIDLTWAFSENPGGGGKTRSSCCRDSMLVTVDIDLARLAESITTLVLVPLVYHRST